jgi:hypothetical protein
MDDFYGIAMSPWYYCRNSIITIVIEDDVTSIGLFAFEDCTNLTTINIGNSVITIHELAFFHCGGLLSIDVDANNIRYSSNNGILYTKLQDTLIRYPESKIGTAVIPNSVTVIENRAFQDCSKLISISIPNTVTTIGYLAFWKCVSLISVSIPNSVITIGYGAFSNCVSLISINIPNSVTFIDSWTFEDCSSLDTIICEAIYPPAIEQNTFLNVPKTVRVYIPCDTYDYYINASGWNYFSNFIDPCVGISEALETSKMKIFPNPAHNQLTITNYELRENDVIEIYNVVGQMVYTSPNPSKGGESAPSLLERAGGEVAIDVSHLPNGMYFLKVGNRVVKFVKE